MTERKRKNSGEGTAKFPAQWVVILRILSASPGLRPTDMLQAYHDRLKGATKVDLHMCLDRMQRRRLIESHKIGQYRFFNTTPLGRQALEAWEFLKSFASGRKAKT